MQTDVEMRIAELAEGGLGGFGGAVEHIMPELASSARIQRRSTSAAVVNGDTGEEFPSAGEHIYLFIEDGADAKRFLDILHGRAWLSGLGWYLIGRTEQLLERSIVDRIVAAPERLVFEAAPTLVPPLRQLRRLAFVHDGAALDSRAACADLSDPAKKRLKKTKAAAASALKGASEAAAAAFVAEKIGEAVARGVEPARAKEMAEAWRKGDLRPDAMLEFDDMGQRSVAEILADPEAFIGKTLADPIEGVPYGRDRAIVRQRDNGDLIIWSFAHGGATYWLIDDRAPQKGNAEHKPSRLLTIEETLAVFDKWLALSSRTPVLAVLGAVAANRLEGDPVWIGVVAPPSSAKTEIINSLSLLPNVAQAATLTPAALLSGSPRRDRDKGAKGGLLREIGDFGILALKDFGSACAPTQKPNSSPP